MVYLFAAYTVVWLGVLGYALAVSRQNRRLALEIEALESALAMQGEKGRTAPEHEARGS